MKLKEVDKIEKQLDAHLKQVSTARDKLDNTITELEGLRWDCDEAMDSIKEAKESLQNARDALSKLV